MTTLQRPVAAQATVSVVAQLGGKAAHLVLNVVSTLAVLHYLAPAAYGSYVLVVTVVTLAGVVADFGLPKLAVREVTRELLDPQRAEDEIVGTVAVIRLALALAAAVSCQGILVVLHQPPVVHQAALVASLVLLVEAVLGVVVVSFQVHVVQQYEAFVRVLAELVETTLVLVLIALHASLLQLFVPPLIGLLVGTLLAWRLARRRCTLRPRLVRQRVRALLVEALPLGPALLISVVYLKLDSLVLARLRPSHDLGIYGSAYQPIEYLFLASSVVINVLFPILGAAYGRGDSVRFLSTYRRGTELLVILTAFVPLTFAFAAPGVVRLALGAPYAEAALPLQILSVALVAMTLSAWLSLVLLAGGWQRVTLAYNAVALLVALVSCTLLVSRLGLVGAALSALTTSILVLGASLYAVRRRMRATLELRRLGCIAVACTLMAAGSAGSYSAGSPWVVTALVGALVYALVLSRFGFHRSLREVFG